jgi:hypothetical protein
VFNYLLLSPAASEQAAGRRFSFDPLPLLFIGVEAIDAKLEEEVIKMPMNEVMLPHLMEMTKQLHLLAQPSHWVKGLYAKFYMSPSNIKHIDSGPCRALLFFCHKHIHSVTELRCVATENHTTQIIIKPKGGYSPMHHDGPTGTKKAVDNGAGEMKQVTDHDRESRNQECVQAGEFCRSLTATGITKDQQISLLFLESNAGVAGDDGQMGQKMKVVYKREAGETVTIGMFANGMQVGMLLQPNTAAATGNRLTGVRFKHCTGATQRRR